MECFEKALELLRFEVPLSVRAARRRSDGIQLFSGQIQARLERESTDESANKVILEWVRQLNCSRCAKAELNEGLPQDLLDWLAARVLSCVKSANFSAGSIRLYAQSAHERGERRLATSLKILRPFSFMTALNESHLKFWLVVAESAIKKYPLKLFGQKISGINPRLEKDLIDVAVGILQNALMILRVDTSSHSVKMRAMQMLFLF